MRHPVVPMTVAELEERDTPTVVQGGNLEAYAHTLYAHTLYVSGATTNLEFFTETGNKRITNAVNRLPSPQFFLLYGIHVDFFVDPDPAAWQDLWQLMYGTAGGTTLVGRPTLTFTYASKDYGPEPLSAFHGTGALTGFGTATNLNYGNNYIPDGGFFQDGGLLLAPNQDYSALIEWPAALTLLRGDTQIGVTLSGTHYRKIT